jgi:hypothetical protein
LSALPELRSWGLSAIEAVYPGYKKSKTLELRAAAGLGRRRRVQHTNAKSRASRALRDLYDLYKAMVIP